MNLRLFKFHEIYKFSSLFDIHATLKNNCKNVVYAQYDHPEKPISQSYILLNTLHFFAASSINQIFIVGTLDTAKTSASLVQVNYNLSSKLLFGP